MKQIQHVYKIIISYCRHRTIPSMSSRLLTVLIQQKVSVVKIVCIVISSKRLSKNFGASLRNHLLGRLLGRPFDGDTDESFSDEDWNSVWFKNNTIYRHQTIRINYATYDMHRELDTINTRTHPYIMVASPETEADAHPFWYVAVLGVFHAHIQHIGVNSLDLWLQKVEFLWVRWRGVVPDSSRGRENAKLPETGFVPDSDDYAFGFLDPSLVIRGLPSSTCLQEW